MNFGVFFALIAVIGSSFFEASLESKQTGDSSKFSLCRQIDEGTFYSQAEQDKFVYCVLYGLLGKQDKGYYLEIGAGEPIYINNSYFFEKNLQWNGVSIDISDNVNRWLAVRKNLLLSEDATRSDYTAILKTFPHVIDYLSLDIDGHYDSVLEKLAYSNHVFKVITIEHDFYRYGDLYRQKEREILTGLGYYLLCSDVSHDGYAFEDWWIYPDFFPSNIFSMLTSLDLQAKNHREIIQAIKTIVHDNN